MFNQILVVCVGNICRSPMGKYLLQDCLEEVGDSIVVESAGLGALVGHGADPLAVEVMMEHGVDMSAHHARQLDSRLVRKNELILVMEAWQQTEVERLYPFARGRVHLLGKWSDMEIADPYRKPREYFVEAYEKINKACEEWCNKLC